jgi:hypothetical protein
MMSLQVYPDSAVWDAASAATGGRSLVRWRKRTNISAIWERFQHQNTIADAGKGIVTHIWTQNPHCRASIVGLRPVLG